MIKNFGIIKPNAMSAKIQFDVLDLIEKLECQVFLYYQYRLSIEDAEFLYLEHQNHPNYRNSIDFMSSGASALLIIYCPFSIETFKEKCGNADPKKAKFGTIRKMYGEDYTRNTIHASDSEASFLREFDYFSKKLRF